jgi:hypothetical protein
MSSLCQDLHARRIAPRCDKHPDSAMEFRSATTHISGLLYGVVALFCCTQPGCQRMFYDRTGYADTLKDQSEIRCNRHGDERTYMFVRPVANGGYEYACPVRGCEHTRRYPPALRRSR